MGILIGDTNLIVLVIKTITSTDSTPIIADATVDIDESFAFESHRSDAEKMVYNIEHERFYAIVKIIILDIKLFAIRIP